MPYKYSKDDKSNFVYKHETHTKQGSLKAKYKDLPRLKLITEIEEAWSQSFEHQIKEGLKNGLKSFLN